MCKLYRIGLFFIAAANMLNAQDGVEILQESDRLHSVKKVIATGGLTEGKDISVVDSFRLMFRDAKVSGQARVLLSNYYLENSADTYATAVGGMLRYELAEYNGFGGGVGFVTSNDLNFATGENDNHNSELSSENKKYNQLSEAYMNYNYDSFNFCAGAQTVDTPLADSDDIRMVANTFEAYIATYKAKDLIVMAGNLQQWQGHDTGLSNGWIDSGEDGTWFGGAAYNDNVLKAEVWYYNISDSAASGVSQNSSLYLEFGLAHQSNDIFMHTDIQYLKQTPHGDGRTEASIYGLFGEIVSHGIGFSVAYNKSQKKDGKSSFSGFGGGTLYTNMDNMIIDNITQDRSVRAVLARVSYSVEDFQFLYAYGDFNGDANSIGVKEWIIEQNMGIEYSFNNELAASAIYTIDKYKRGDAEVTGIEQQNNFRLQVTYNF